MLGFAVAGAFVAGLYGIVHDQITYSISNEYFTKLKFDQFSYLDFGMSDRFFVCEIGFLATGSVGFFIGWFLARWFIPRQPYDIARRKISFGFIIVLLIGALFAALAWIFGAMIQPSSNLNGWSYMVKYLGINDGWAFVRVAYIHYSSYAGGLFGLILAIAVLGHDRVRT